MWRFGEEFGEGLPFWMRGLSRRRRSSGPRRPSHSRLQDLYPELKDLDIDSKDAIAIHKAIKGSPGGPKGRLTDILKWNGLANKSGTKPDLIRKLKAHMTKLDSTTLLHLANDVFRLQCDEAFFTEMSKNRQKIISLLADFLVEPRSGQILEKVEQKVEESTSDAKDGEGGPIAAAETLDSFWENKLKTCLRIKSVHKTKFTQTFHEIIGMAQWPAVLNVIDRVKNDRRELLVLRGTKNTALIHCMSMKAPPEVIIALAGNMTAEEKSRVDTKTSNKTALHYVNAHTTPEVVRVIKSGMSQDMIEKTSGRGRDTIYSLAKMETPSVSDDVIFELLNGCSQEFLTNSFETPFMHGVNEERDATVSKKILNLVDENFTDEKGRTIPMIIIRTLALSSPYVMEILGDLSYEQKTKVDDDGLNILMHALKSQRDNAVLDKILEDTPREYLDCVDQEGRTPLMIACSVSAELFKMVLDRVSPANLEILDEVGRHVGFYIVKNAARFRNDALKVVSEMSRRQRTHIPEDGKTLLMKAVTMSSSDSTLIGEMIDAVMKDTPLSFRDYQDSKGRTAIMLGFRKQTFFSEDICDKLLDGVNQSHFSITDENGRSLVWFALGRTGAMFSPNYVVDKIIGMMTCEQRLISDDNGMTLLDWTCRYRFWIQNAELIDALQVDAPISWRRNAVWNGTNDYFQDTPLMKAVGCGNIEGVDSLIKDMPSYYIETRGTMKDEVNPYQDVVSLALRYRQFDLALHILDLVSDEFLFTINPDKSTLLLTAVSLNAIPVVEKLLSRNPPREWIQNQNRNGHNALHICMLVSGGEMKERLLPEFDRRARSAINSDGATPAILYLQNASGLPDVLPEVCMKFLRYNDGANINIPEEQRLEMTRYKTISQVFNMTSELLLQQQVYQYLWIIDHYENMLDSRLSDEDVYDLMPWAGIKYSLGPMVSTESFAEPVREVVNFDYDSDDESDDYCTCGQCRHRRMMRRVIGFDDSDEEEERDCVIM
eukprot:TRINITY_DN17364_c0_g1_i1.p1 TRINITY_DN17364_c0_g1~~TRINITY_DN17364_c0_g1_i1.p1  ORF type:complete len:999 (-),score=207.48 TRINITY_DN17364_c0_g1_i1:170-3166(-)